MNLKLGVVGTSRKENEDRVAIHPRHLSRIPKRYRSDIFFETGYGEPFGIGDDELAVACGGTKSRSELFEDSEVLLLPKPVQKDFDDMPDGTVHWGWPHCVQQRGYTQAAIDRKLTLLAFEAMFHWTRQGQRDLHTFYKNNEMAGYCAVLHALKLTGLDGYYGPRRQGAVLSFGSVSRGAIRALQGRGFSDLTVYTRRPPWLVRDQMAGCEYRQLVGTSGALQAAHPDGSRRPLIEELSTAEIIVNGILQDTDNPLMFIEGADLERLTAGTLIIDVSCDEGMGFPFARPTSFEDPMFPVGNARYYAVDHTPTYLWDAASWEISEALLPYLPSVLDGPDAWDQNETLRRSIEIREGVIQNPKILSFQKRSSDYPHPPRD